MERRFGRRGGDAEDAAFALVREHAYELLRFARRFSLCDDDAEDAYQRTLEILVRQLRGGRAPHSTLSWVRTVLRHEAYQVRRERERRLGSEDHDVEQQCSGPADDPAERVERFERLTQAAEALRRLKPQEVTALVLRAEGLSYKEICERTQWSYTRCNRCVTEGRRAFLERLAAIESGAECERWLPQLSLLADGEASSRDLAEVRPHLRACSACRATLRSFHEAPRQVGAIVPVALLPVAAAGAGGGAPRHLETVVHWVLERSTASAVRLQGAIDALSGTKLAAVAASTVAVAGSGAAIERAATDRAERDRAARTSQVTSDDGSPTAAAVPIATDPIVLPSSDGAFAAAPGATDDRAGEGGAEAVGEFTLEPAAEPVRRPPEPDVTAPPRQERTQPPVFDAEDEPSATDPPTAPAARAARAEPPVFSPPPPAPPQRPAPSAAPPEFAGF